MRTILLCWSATAALAAVGCGQSSESKAIETAALQVARIADAIDRRTNEAGVYVRVKQEEMRERDPWGQVIRVDYSAGGVAEMVNIRSAGPDRVFNTEDDITAERMVANFKGIGQGIKDNTEETAANAAKGLIKGTVVGIKEVLPRRKRKDESADEPRNSEPAPPTETDPATETNPAGR